MYRHIHVRLEAPDASRLERLMADTGISRISDLIRHALAELAKARGLETAAQQLRREP